MPRLAALTDRILDDLAHPGEHQVPERDTLEHLAPLPVDDLALLVHDIVVLDQVAAGGRGGAPALRLGPRALLLHPPRLAPPPRAAPAPAPPCFCRSRPPRRAP